MLMLDSYSIAIISTDKVRSFNFLKTLPRHDPALGQIILLTCVFL